MQLNGCRFDNSEDIQTELQVVLNNHVRVDSQGVMYQCIHVQRNYFEGNGGNRSYDEFVLIYGTSLENF